MMNWKTIKLSELGEIIGGATPPTSRADYYEGNIAWITPKDLAGYSERYISHGDRYITVSGLASCSAQMLPTHSILFSSRAPIGYVAIAANEMCTNQGFKSVVPNKNVDYLFLYYLLKYNKDKIEALGSGTTFKEVSGKTMKSIEVTVPSDIAEQRKISSVLGALDDKIELNNKINANLQQQAQAIFSNMFTNNPDCITVSGRLSDIATVTMGQSPNGDSYNESGEGEVFYQGRAEFGFRFPKRRLYTTEPKRFAESEDVLLSVRAPVGDINIAFERCCIGRGLSALHSKDGNSSFLLYTMFELKSKLDVFNNEGTVFGSINRDSLNNMALDLPSREDICRFENIVRPMDNMIRGNFAENCRLQLIRDSLLPKLMSGEIDVLEINV